MKKVRIILLCLLTLIMSISCSCNKEKEYNGFVLKLTNGIDYVIVDYIGPESEITLPFEYDGVSVGWISPNHKLTNVKKINIVDECVAIQKSSFDNVELVVKNEVLTEKLFNYLNSLNKTLVINVDVEFLSNSDNLNDSKYIYSENETITIPDYVGTNLNEDFIGWSYNDTLYMPGESFTIGRDDVSFTPVFRDEIKVSFDVSKYDLDVLEDINTSKGTTVKLPEVSLEYHSFLGWYNGETLFTNETIFNEDITLEPRFEKTHYEVTFINEVTNAQNKLYIKINEDYVFTHEDIEGYEFIGWYLGENLVSNGLELNSDATLQGKYEKTMAEITFDVNHGDSLDFEKKLYNIGSKATFPLPTRSGYKFMGWSESLYGAWIDKYTYNKVKYDVTDDVTLYALWIPDEYANNCIQDTFENNPWHHIYYVKTYDELINLPTSGYVFLENDINMRKKEWTPLGDNVLDESIEPFKGYFDGNGYVIRNFKITNPKSNNVGFFGAMEGYVYNLNLTNVEIEYSEKYIDSDVYIGGMCGNQLKGKIINCKVDNVTINTKYGYVGLLCGESKGLIEDVEVKGTLSLNGDNIISGGLVSNKLLYSKNQLDASNVSNVLVDVTVIDLYNNPFGGLYGKCEGALKTNNVSIKLTTDSISNKYNIAYSLKDTYLNNINYEANNSFEDIHFNDNSVIN